MTDDPPITVSRRTALAALGGTVALGGAGVSAASMRSGSEGGRAGAGGFTRPDGES